ncbi:MAG: PASTA domain-containing protein [Ruminococcus sp.]|nr:PASTA domain-containing protein [Ruminococcus sp.]
MEQYDSSLHVCPSCGYVESAEYDPMYVPPGTILHTKYLCGILLEYNGEGATYIGCDISTGKKVFIREYMPINLCTRVKNKPTISVNYNNLAKYKAFMAEYTELNKSLARLRNNSNIPPVLDMFAENNTTYTVFEYIEGVKILDYLKENAGELSWEEVSKIFPPLFTTIGILHNAGIIHRAISPDTVYITDKGELKLWGFCVSAVRTANAGLEYELFKGYAAPEQYSASSSSRQGSWTDVYGVCALLYRALTGCMPVDSVSRQNHDDLHEPNTLDSSIPKHVSRVIMEGMNLNGRDRIQTITELVTKLFEQSEEEETEDEDFDSTLFLNDRPGTSAPDPEPEPVIAPAYHAVQPSAPLPEEEVIHQHNTPAYSRPLRDDSYSYEKVNTVDRIKVPVIIGLLFLSILLIIVVLLMHIFSTEEEEDTTSKSRSKRSTIVSDNVVDDNATTKEKNIVMPRLIGRFYEIEKKNTEFNLEAVYEYNDDYENDMIFEQSVPEGEMIAEGDTIVIKVSKGKSKATIPEFSGKTVDQYKNALDSAGISSHNYEFVESKNSSGKANTIIELRSDGKKVEPGTVFDCSSGKKLTVYYASGSGSQQSTTSAVTTTAVATTTANTTTTAAATTTAVPTTTAAPTTTQAPITTAPPTDPPTEPPTEPPTDPPTEAPPVEVTTIDDGGQG